MANGSDIPDDLMQRLTAWLLHDANREEKDAAMWDLFCRTMNGEMDGNDGHAPGAVPESMGQPALTDTIE